MEKVIEERNIRHLVRGCWISPFSNYAIISANSTWNSVEISAVLWSFLKGQKDPSGSYYAYSSPAILTLWMFHSFSAASPVSICKCQAAFSLYSTAPTRVFLKHIAIYKRERCKSFWCTWQIISSVFIILSVIPVVISLIHKLLSTILNKLFQQQSKIILKMLFDRREIICSCSCLFIHI